MRTAFIEALFDVATKDPRVMLLVGDLGFGVVTKFASELPDQFLNAGVAEQNMTSVAAGLALSGRIVFTYSIANFPLLRCYEQVRNDVCYHNANVKVVAVGGGFAYGALGVSHHATEDIAIARALPNLTVIAPNDPVEAAAATRAVAAHNGPVYLRLDRAGERCAHQGAIDFRIGRAIPVRSGRDVTLIAGGGLLGTAMDAASALEQAGHSTAVISIHTIKPLDDEAVVAAAQKTPAVFTIEEHSVIGGLGGAVSELLMERGIRPRVFRRFGIADRFISRVGTQDYLRRNAGLDAASIAAAVGQALRDPLATA